MMTGKQRYLATLNGEAVDHLARIPILMRYAAEYIGSNYGAFASDYRVLVEANLRCAADFGYDQWSAISDPYRETTGFGGRVVYSKNEVPECTYRPLKDSMDLARLESPDPESSPRMRDRLMAVEALARQGPDYSILGWIEGPAAEAATLRDTENLFMDLMEEPGFVADLMDVCVEAGLAFARAQMDRGADTIGIGDAVVSQVSPENYRDLIRPRQLRLMEGIRQMGGRVRLHICGNTTHLLDQFAGLPIDILDVDHLVDLKAARRAMGSQVVLAGNLDPVGGVMKGTPDSIRTALVRMFGEAGQPYCVNAGCEIPSGTPVENLKALCAPFKG
ncbi:MAG: uroporphyrinogen decarboxylase family protein [Opitutaceae bacterium]